MATTTTIDRELYKDALDNVSAFNARLCYERKMRVPFLDAQTGIAMMSSHLWLSKLMRRPGCTPHYVYSYPARRWRKRKKGSEPPRGVAEEERMADKHALPEQDIAVLEEVENLQEAHEDFSVPTVSQEARKEIAPREVEGSLPEASDDDEPEQEAAASTDDEEFEIISVKRKRGRPGRKKRPTGHTASMPTPVSLQVKNISKEELAKMDPEDRKKPYVCEICGKRYKNGPGLKYHYLHYNHEQDTSTKDEEAASHPSTPNPEPAPAPFQTRGPGRPRKEVSFPPQLMHQPAPAASSVPHAVTPNNYCDFCLGDVTENKKTGLPEELLSCADCGRSGHPTCLQFTSRLTESVKKYKWQCIECKSCTKCGTSDNDDQLLFCDDCDRGYHMYCLRPPMENPPEGHWTCQLCKDTFHLLPFGVSGAP